jgi:hypothetical protein
VLEVRSAFQVPTFRNYTLVNPQVGSPRDLGVRHFDPAGRLLGDFVAEYAGRPCKWHSPYCGQTEQHIIDVEIATGPDKGRRIFIPLLSSTPSDTERMPFTLRRRQFPLRPTFAMTINKAQGQTL